MGEKSKHLVTGHLEHVSSKLFSDYSAELTAQVGKQHLRDKHSGKWDKFSVYLVRKVDHIKELESLILRVVDPKGNTKMGKLPNSEDLKISLTKGIRRSQFEQLATLMGKTPKIIPTLKRATRKTDIKVKTKQKNMGEMPSLSPYVTHQFTIRHLYKGKLHKATVRKSGWIIMQGKKYSTPTAAALNVVNRPTVNGWSFWRYKDSDGKWIPIKNLRGKAK